MNKQPHSFLENIFGKNQPTFENLVKQIDKEIKKGTIKPVSPVNLVINMISLSIFPFVAKPVFQRIMNLDALQFGSIMDQRKTMNAEFIIASIKK
jgi:malate/lactate dehydrogenase